MRLAPYLAMAPLALAACTPSSTLTATPAGTPAATRAHAVVAASSAAQAAPAASATLTVEVTGAELADGVVRVGLYDSAEAFAAGEDPVRKAVSMPTASRVKFTFADLEPGVYAVHAFQDRDKNRACTMDRGMPIEPFTFSNDEGQPLDAPPTFEMAAFELNDADQSLSMRLRPAS